MKPEPLSTEFLICRGKCCGSGCINCPYTPKHEKGSMKINVRQYKKVFDENKS